MASRSGCSKLRDHLRRWTARGCGIPTSGRPASRPESARGRAAPGCRPPRPSWPTRSTSPGRGPKARRLSACRACSRARQRVRAGGDASRRGRAAQRKSARTIRGTGNRETHGHLEELDEDGARGITDSGGGIKSRGWNVKISFQWVALTASETNAASSASAIRRMPPTWPTWASTPCSTGGRSRPESPPSTTARSTSRGRWATSPTCSTSRGSRGLPGKTAIGHVRYSTAGASLLINAQPIVFATGRGTPGAGPQRQPGQRAGDPDVSGAERGHVHDDVRLRGDPAPDRPLQGADAWPAPSPRRCSRFAARTRS